MGKPASLKSQNDIRGHPVSVGEKMSERIIYLNGDYLAESEAKLPLLDRGLLFADAVYEGFGIPILEAMVAGKPMVLSDLEIFREITQNQSVYFDEGNVESIADAIEIGLCSQQVREDMVEYGFHRVHDFEFGHLANRLCELYRAHLF